MRLTGGLLEAGPGKERRKEARLCLGRWVAVRDRGAALAPQAGQGLRAEGAAHSESWRSRKAGARVERWAGGVSAAAGASAGLEHGCDVHGFAL